MLGTNDSIEKKSKHAFREASGVFDHQAVLGNTSVVSASNLQTEACLPRHFVVVVRWGQSLEYEFLGSGKT